MEVDWRKEAASRLDKERFIHTLGVEEMAVALAQQYGADEEKASIAALGHDLFRQMGYPSLLALAEEWGMDVAHYLTVGLLHGPVAATYLCHMGITDGEILDAVYYHTTGRKGMTLLDHIIYVADKCEKNRDYPGVEGLRTLAQENLPFATYTILKRAVQRRRQKGQPIEEDSLLALSELEESMAPFLAQEGGTDFDE
ncbi:bis(5'-nucleosyl)-tetraphosphatase (symmetrical) YqeK [Eubacteriales bacterium OttesenSCG-928-M02]|nr:bis(5'-nucleosyl)-tetraphosphatase (symmetrical) YqeK [Eubacteriales bacterium OttesenSCG-928-M02]